MITRLMPERLEFRTYLARTCKAVTDEKKGRAHASSRKFPSQRQRVFKIRAIVERQPNVLTLGSKAADRPMQQPRIWPKQAKHYQEMAERKATQEQFLAVPACHPGEHGQNEEAHHDQRETNFG